MVRKQTVQQIDDDVLQRMMMNGKEGEILFYKGGIYKCESDGLVPQVSYRRWVQIPLLMELGVEL